MMSRRYALLEDNQRLLETRLAELGRRLPTLVSDRACAAAVIGSVAEGRARDESDIDLVVVLRQGEPERRHYHWWDEEVAGRLVGPRDGARFPIRPLIIGRGSVATREPHLRSALDRAIPIWDPDRVLTSERIA